MTVAIRHTVAVVGLVLGYAVIGEGLLRGLWPSVERVLVSNNVFAFIQDGHTVERWPDECFDGCSPTLMRFTLGDSLLYFAVLGGLILLGSFLVFRRRDVP